jgi:hypothetical protein
MDDMIDLALAAQVLLWLIVLGVFLASGQASIFHPLSVYLAFHLVVFVIRPMLVHYLDFNHNFVYMLFEPSEEQFIRALAVSSVAFVVFAVTCLAVGWHRPGFPTPAPAPFGETQRQALVLLTVLLIPPIAYSIHSNLSGGMQGEHRGGTFVLTGASGYTLEAQFMAGPLICAWLAVGRFRWPAVLPLVPYLFYRTYSGGSRWTLVLLFLALALVYAWQKRIKWLPLWSVVCAVPLFFLFHAVGENRGALGEYLAGGEFEHTRAQEGMTATEQLRAKYDDPDFANFDFLTFVTAMVPERTGAYTYGSQYLQLFTEPIPRKLWPGKPAGAPVRSFNLNDYGNFLGMTVTLAGDGWMSGGWIGLVVTMGIVGVFLGLAHRWFWRRVGSNMVSLIYLVGLAMLPQWYRDGGISIAKFVFWNLSPLVLWLVLTWLLGRRLVPVSSVLLPRGARLRLISARPTIAATEAPSEHAGTAPSP